MLEQSIVLCTMDVAHVQHSVHRPLVSLVSYVHVYLHPTPLSGTRLLQANLLVIQTIDFF